MMSKKVVRKEKAKKKSKMDCEAEIKRKETIEMLKLTNTFQRLCLKNIF